jgi:hypothetical protein
MPGSSKRSVSLLFGTGDLSQAITAEVVRDFAECEMRAELS